MSSPEPQRHRASGVFTQVWDGYSLTERDRRWNAVRAEAAKGGVDCIFVPVGDGLNARYLTQFRASSVVLPADGREPIVITDRGSSNAWLPEPRLTAREWSEPMAEALLNAGMERARIGVTGLFGGRFAHVGQPEGVVCHGAFADVRRRLPEARFEDASDILGRVRYVKSEEEIECIRRAASIAEAGIQEFLRQAQAGADETLVRARVLGLMLRLGSEYYPLRLANAAHSLTAEINAVWGTQVVRMVERTPAVIRPTAAFDAVLGLIKLGTRFGDVLDEAPAEVTLQSIGSGDDGPLLSRSASTGVRDLRFEPNTAFTLSVASFARPILISPLGAAVLE